MRAAALAVVLLPAALAAAPYAPVWTRTFDSAGHLDDVAEAVAVDAAGNVYVAGWTDRSDAGAGVDARVVKYSPEGALVWARTHGGTPGSDEFAFGLAVAADGSVWVAGSVSNTGGAADGWLRRYDAAGAVLSDTLWVNPASGGGQAVFWAVAVDAVSGSVYAAGSQQRDDLAQAGNALLVRYGPDGSSPVVMDESDTAGYWDEWLAAAPVPGGGVAVAGYVGVDDAGGKLHANPLLKRREEDLFRHEEADTNIAVRRYAPGGSFWSGTYGSEFDPKTRMDWARGVAVDGAGRVIVAGSVDLADPSRYDAWVRSWAADGSAAVWTRQFAEVNSKADPADFCTAAAAGAGMAVTAGASGRPDKDQARNLTVNGFDAGAGFPAITAGYSDAPFIDEQASAVAVDGVGAVVVAGWEDRTDLAQQRNWVVRKYAAGADVPAPEAGEVRAWPNPFAPARAAGGTFKVGGLPPGAKVRVYTQAGRLVRELAEAGGGVAWDGRTTDGAAAAAGVYGWVAVAGGTRLGRGAFALVRP